MKLSELIAKLQETLTDVGDKEILIDTVDEWLPVEKVIFHNTYVVIHGDDK